MGREENLVPSYGFVNQKDELVAIIELPGVDQKDIKISLSDNNLTVQEEIEQDKDMKREDYYCCERAYGKFSRRIFYL
ncbi:MAG: Hsp20/alpha crystallin family protein [Atribacterota bacterium]|jgi:HSP20 family protein|nr:Hsp20/alpha crystallin family protein [Atribacterota bacterium]MDD4895679.1 Hsp20/alpha crystallin family protein [Atribacterota bacterium]MDD5637146.1 Hsp20/alpha crystallin family protein [Atribacterota bacterium]